MNGPDYITAAAALFNAFVFEKAIPLVALIGLFLIMASLLVKAQRKNGFNIEEMFKDEADKVSAARVLACFAFCISSWDLMAARLSGTADAQHYFYYLGAWSGALIFVKMADKWDGSLPFGKGKE